MPIPFVSASTNPHLLRRLFNAPTRTHSLAGESLESGRKESNTNFNELKALRFMLSPRSKRGDPTIRPLPLRGNLITNSHRLSRIGKMKLRCSRTANTCRNRFQLSRNENANGRLGSL